MKTDKIVIELRSDLKAHNYVCMLLDEGYVLLSKKYDEYNCRNEYHLRKTPFTWLMAKLSKKV